MNPGNDEAEEYRGSHRRVEDDEVVAEGGSTAAAAGGIPKRGLAMILIAVAAILLLWGIYAMTQKGSGDNAAAPASPTAQVKQPSQPAQQPQGQPTQQQQQQQSPQPNPQQGTQPNPQPQPGAPAPALTKQNAKVYVFNNSANPGLAGTTADKLAPEYSVANKSADSKTMNLPEQTFGIFPETTVFFDPQVSGADQVAAEVAQQVGGVAKPVSEIPQGASLPGEAKNNREAISVVLAG
ncbi:hypothetical protein C3E79_09580 [Corynebacterium liangguodongii]|uniref:Uncharacterized protein n=1 Tax=Corynebacterium liangguodongii TaxID=2079535 RepID=A0A2S0WG05_9CORY|nr:hypothetical protein C3E79_09580 [Corynebacterium liangguodongii]PWB99698.1 hypothetical protein DF219_05360 [Corynebacterium liangguodongii]